MPLDPSIILSGQQQPSLSDQIGKTIQLRALAGQGELQGLQVQQARQEMEGSQKLRDLYAGNISPDGTINQAGVLQGAAAQGLGDRIPGLQKGFNESARSSADLTNARTEGDAKQFDLTKKRVDATNGLMASLLSKPDVTHNDVAQGFADMARQGLITDDQAVAAIRSLPGPGQLRPFLMQKAMQSLDAAKQLELQRPKFEKIDTGGQVLAGTVDQMTGQFTPQQAIQKTESPDGARFRENALKPPAGYRWTAEGNLESITGGPADKKEGQRNAVPTEGERKAATLYSRLKFSEQQLQDALAGAPGAAKPSLISEGARAVAGDTAANSVTGQERQRVEAAQLDLLDAALTLGTGAAYTKEQLRGYARSYFPQIGDDKKTIADKQSRLQNVIGAARISAGRAAEDADAMPGPQPQVGPQLGADDQAALSWANANPNDPRAAQIKQLHGGQ